MDDGMDNGVDGGAYSGKSIVKNNRKRLND